MSDESQDFRPIWVSDRTFDKLLQITSSLVKKDGQNRNPDKVIDELIEFWEGYQNKRE